MTRKEQELKSELNEKNALLQQCLEALESVCAQICPVNKAECRQTNNCCVLRAIEAARKEVERD